VARSSGGITDERLILVTNAPSIQGHTENEELLSGGECERADDREVHEILRALRAMRVGDFSVRMPGGQIGIWGKVADTFNDIVAAAPAPCALPCR
jgi:hypothetical protein